MSVSQNSLNYQPCWEEYKESLNKRNVCIILKIKYVNNCDMVLCPFTHAFTQSEGRYSLNIVKFILPNLVPEKQNQDPALK